MRTPWSLPDTALSFRIRGGSKLTICTEAGGHGGPAHACDWATGRSSGLRHVQPEGLTVQNELEVLHLRIGEARQRVEP
jgi:hypothetical protein